MRTKIDMEKKDLTILKEQLKETGQSMMFGSIAILAIVFAGNMMEKTFNLPSLFSTLVNYIAPWAFALMEVALIIKFIKLKRTIKKLDVQTKDR